MNHLERRPANDLVPFHELAKTFAQGTEHVRAADPEGGVEDRHLLLHRRPCIRDLGVLAERLHHVLPDLWKPDRVRRRPLARLATQGRVHARAGRQSEVGDLIERGLASIGRLAESRSPSGFVGLAGPERAALLREVEAAEPAFFGALLMQTYFGYYTDRRITDRLGVRNPPQPDGYDLEPGDLSLLDPVRVRPKLWRDPPAPEE